MQVSSRSFLLSLFSIALIASEFFCLVSAEIFEPDSFDFSVPDDFQNRYIVGFKSHDSFISFSENELYGALILDQDPFINAIVMKFDSEKDAQEWADARDDIEYVEEDGIFFLADTDENITGETTPYGIDMVHGLDIPDYVAGSGIKMCIIDSGYAHGHEDLPNNTDIVTGQRRFCSRTCHWYEDTLGHGTHVAGTIAAIGNNGKGVEGVVNSNDMPIYIVRAYEGASAMEIRIIQAIGHCRNNNANVVNMSLSSKPQDKPSESLKKAIERHSHDGILFVAAAGNEGGNGYNWPASFPDVLSVASVYSNRTKSEKSQVNDQVNLAAPGIAINSTDINNTYRTRSGTSFATPHVAAIAAKIWSHKPSMTSKEVRDLLTATAEDLGVKGRDDEFGWGLVDASAAYKLLQNDIPCEDTSVGFLFEGEQRKCAWVVHNNSTELCQNDSIKSVCPETCQACAYKCSDATLPFYPLQIWKQMTCEKLATDFTSHEMNEICGWSKFRNTCRKTCNYCEL